MVLSLGRQALKLKPAGRACALATLSNSVDFDTSAKL